MPSILLVEFKGKTDKPAEAYTSVPGFIERYPMYSFDEIHYRLTRLRQPFEDTKLKITRIELFTREK